MKIDTHDKGEYYVINSGSNTKYAHLKGGISDIYNSCKCISKSVTSSTTDNFKYILDTNGCANKKIIYTVS